MIPTDSHQSDDNFNLIRFEQAQSDCYTSALSELRSGRKRTHWMWFIFPQLDGLARSSTSRHFAIKNLNEARAYLSHPVLGSRLLECAAAVLKVEGATAQTIFGSPDDLKLKSCATLFACVSPADPVFERLLEKYFAGTRDAKTLELLKMQSEPPSQP